ncbi:MAG: M14 family metallopeptidase [Verrucomicrobiota bacterium]|nr:M14 family metallopeptidase [Verrucomicrobiota bacterium]
MKLTGIFLGSAVAAFSLHAQPAPDVSPKPQPQQFSEAASQPILPPLIPWNGKSRSLVVAKTDPWITPSEKNDFRATPSYDEMTAWLKKLVAAAPQLKMISLGKSPEGRDVWMIVASREKQFTPEELRKNGKPTIMAQAGIHPGEIDGKDAGLMLLRDMTVRGTKKDLLEHANFLFVPIFNVDGHERGSKFGRVNQRGPEVTGWRTNAKNLNLNRDYAKIDTPEMEGMIRALNQWQPDLYVDLHVTDGADYQYDITFGFNGAGGHSPAIANWLEKTFTPAVTNDLAAMGHIPGSTDVAGWIDPLDLSKGIKSWLANPRYSNGYGDVRHLPAVLVENHSLKPYDQRVLGTYVFLEGAIRAVASNVAALRQSIDSDRKANVATIPLAWDIDPAAAAETIEYKAIESHTVPSAISGGLRIEFTGKPVTLNIPFKRGNHVIASVTRPKAYWIPPAWNEVVQRLQLHGIQLERISESRDVKVTMYRLEEMKFQGKDETLRQVEEEQPFEGRVQISAKPIAEQRTAHYPAGSVRVPTNQPLGDLAAVLLEPASPDSFLQWGFFDEVFQQTEYIEGYILEPMAERMLASDPKLAEEFRQKLTSDEAFRASPKERLRWFYSKTPFVDERWKLYSIGREE